MTDTGPIYQGTRTKALRTTAPHAGESTTIRSPDTAASTASTDKSQTRLALGARIEIQLKSILKSGDLEVLLRTPGDAQWSGQTRVGILDNLRSSLIKALSTSHTAQVQQTPGKIFTAEVVSLSPKISLRLINPDSSGSPADRRTWLNAQLRAHIPTARPLAPALADLTRAFPAAKPMTTAATQQTQGPQQAQLQDAVKQVLSQLTSPRDLTDPVRLPAALKTSGIWFEALLAQAATTQEQSTLAPLKKDLKGQLLRLAEAVRAAAGQPGAKSAPSLPASQSSRTGQSSQATTGSPTSQTTPASQTSQTMPASQSSQTSRTLAPSAPATLTQGAQIASGSPTRPDMAAETRQTTAQESPTNKQLQMTAAPARDIDAALKQVVTQQLQSMDPDQALQRWTLELPFQTTAGLLALEADIQRDKARGREDDADNWSMELRLDLPVLGPLLLRLSLRGDSLHTTLIAEQSSGARLLRDNLPTLRRQLEARNIEIGSLNARTGCTDKRPPISEPLLSERA